MSYHLVIMVSIEHISIILTCSLNYHCGPTVLETMTMEFELEMEWDAIYEYVTSEEAQALTTSVTELLRTAFDDLEGFIQLKVTEFR